MPKHKHSELIKLWADGAQIEGRAGLESITPGSGFW